MITTITAGIARKVQPAIVGLSVSILFLGVLLPGYASSELRYPAPPQMGVSRSPEVTIDTATGTASMEITVLRGRYQKIKMFKKTLLLLVLLSPAIVLVQEFSDEPAADVLKEQTEPA